MSQHIIVYNIIIIYFLYYSILIQDLLGFVGAEGNGDDETEWMHYLLTAGESIGI
jgi:hypothetical protein